MYDEMRNFYSENEDLHEQFEKINSKKMFEKLLSEKL